MAVVNIYADSNVPASGLGVTSRSVNILQGQNTQIMYSSYNNGTTDTAGSIYRMFKNIDANFVPIMLYIGTFNAQTSLAVSAGLYKPNLGAVTTGGAAVLMAATSIATAAFPLPGLGVNGMAAVYAAGGIAVQAATGELQRLFELAGDSLVDGGSSPYGNPRQYDIALTVTTATTVGGTIACLLLGYMG